MSHTVALFASPSRPQMTMGDAQIFAAEEEGAEGSVHEGTVNGTANYRCKVVLDAHLRDDARTRKLAPELVDCKDGYLTTSKVTQHL